MAIKLPDDIKRDAVTAIKTYVDQELELQIGNLQSEFLLDFVIKQVGPAIYNRAVRDAQTYLQDKLIDLDGELYEA